MIRISRLNTLVGYPRLIGSRSISLCASKWNGQGTYSKQDIIVRSMFPDMEIPDTTYDKYLWNNMNKFSDKIAMVC